MAKHNIAYLQNFMAAVQGCEQMDERKLLENVNPTVRAVEMDDSYSTKEKLKIFSLLTSLTNCAPKERQKFVKKVAAALK